MTMTVDTAIQEPDLSRRRFLTAATGVIGGVGAAMAAVPFISAWSPSAKARALGAPVDVDVSKIEPGQKVTVAWRGQPVFVVNRTPASLATLSQDTDQLRDPNSLESDQPVYAKNETRSIRENILVVVAVCTHLGCVPLYKPKPGSVEPSWLGGFFCPCHGSKYDIAGRVYKGVPAPVNLIIPPYRYLNQNVVRIGESASEGGAV